MPKRTYTVSVELSRRRTIEVEAESPTNAEEIALELTEEDDLHTGEWSSEVID